MALSGLHAEQLAGNIAQLTIRDMREKMSIISQNRIILTVSADTV
jgi:hypothetical protein